MDGTGFAERSQKALVPQNVWAFVASSVKWKALLLCGGCMTIIHSMSKVSVIPPTLQLLPAY